MTKAKIPQLDPDGCGCVILSCFFGVAAVILALALADALARHGWPW